MPICEQCDYYAIYKGFWAISRLVRRNARAIHRENDAVTRKFLHGAREFGRGCGNL